MLDYSEHPCVHCGEHTVVYLQYIADSVCESCGQWELEDDGDDTE